MGWCGFLSNLAFGFCLFFLEVQLWEIKNGCWFPLLWEYFISTTRYWVVYALIDALISVICLLQYLLELALVGYIWALFLLIRRRLRCVILDIKVEFELVLRFRTDDLSFEVLGISDYPMFWTMKWFLSYVCCRCGAFFQSNGCAVGRGLYSFVCFRNFTHPKIGKLFLLYFVI